MARMANIKLYLLHILTIGLSTHLAAEAALVPPPQPNILTPDRLPLPTTHPNPHPTTPNPVQPPRNLSAAGILGAYSPISCSSSIHFIFHLFYTLSNQQRLTVASQTTTAMGMILGMSCARIHATRRWRSCRRARRCIRLGMGPSRRWWICRGGLVVVSFEVSILGPIIIVTDLYDALTCRD